MVKIEYLNRFKEAFRNQYPHITHSLSDKQILKWMDNRSAFVIASQVDLFADYLLSQGLTDEVQE